MGTNINSYFNLTSLNLDIQPDKLLTFFKPNSHTPFALLQIRVNVSPQTYVDLDNG